jgi:uncharacterized protein (DUF1697 family)
VVQKNPLDRVATNPKRYQASFLSAALESAQIQQIEALGVPPGRFQAIGCELCAWDSEGFARPKLSSKLAVTNLGVTATARNRTTVTTLRGMTDG